MQLQKTNSEHRAAFTIKFKVAWLCFDLVQAPSGLSHKWNGPLIAQTKAGIINNHFSKLLPWNAMRTPPPRKASKEPFSSFRESLLLGSAISRPPCTPLASLGLRCNSLRPLLKVWSLLLSNYFFSSLGWLLRASFTTVEGEKNGKGWGCSWLMMVIWWWIYFIKIW